MAIKLTDIYPCNIVNTACELYYIIELGKYSKLLHNESVSLQNITLDKSLYSTYVFPYLRVAVAEGYLVNVNVPSDLLLLDDEADVNNYKLIFNQFIVENEVDFDFAEYSQYSRDYAYKIHNPKPVRVMLKRVDDFLVFKCVGESSKMCSINRSLINTRYAGQTWLSLFAWYVIQNHSGVFFEKLLVYLDTETLLAQDSLSYPLILSECTQALSSNVFFTLDERDTMLRIEKLNLSDEENEYHNNEVIGRLDILKRQCGYNAWYTKGMDMGLCSKYVNEDGDAFRSAQDKLKRMEELGMLVGSPVILYTRTQPTKSNVRGAIESAKIAIIQNVTSKAVTLLCINTTDTFVHSEFIWNKLYTTEVKSMYSKPPYIDLNTTKMSVEFIDLGVEYYLSFESMFIVPLSQADDSIKQCIPKYMGSDEYLLVDMPQNQLIYWICSEYNVPIDLGLFKKAYLGGKAMYDDYVEGKDMGIYSSDSLTTHYGVLREGVESRLLSLF